MLYIPWPHVFPLTRYFHFGEGNSIRLICLFWLLTSSSRLSLFYLLKPDPVLSTNAIFVLENEIGQHARKKWGERYRRLRNPSSSQKKKNGTLVIYKKLLCRLLIAITANGDTSQSEFFDVAAGEREREVNPSGGVSLFFLAVWPSQRMKLLGHTHCTARKESNH